MWKFPRLTESFVSPLPATEVLARIQGATARPAAQRDIYPAQPLEFFRGKVFATGFEVMRATSRPSAAEIKICGAVITLPDKPAYCVRICFQLNGLWLWLTWSLVALAWLLTAVGAFGGSASGALILPLFALLGSTLALPLAFGSELGRARSYLVELLELVQIHE